MADDLDRRNALKLIAGVPVAAPGIVKAAMDDGAVWIKVRPLLGSSDQGRAVRGLTAVSAADLGRLEARRVAPRDFIRIKVASLERLGDPYVIAQMDEHGIFA